MSRVSFKTTYDGKKVEVVGGYDMPLDYYHLTVFNPPEDDEECAWAGLDHFDFSQMRTLDYAKEQLKSMGIEPPDGFWVLCGYRLGNAFFDWDGSGWVRSGDEDPSN